MDDFSSCLPPPPSARALYASTPQRAAAARRNTQTFARAHESHFTRPLFHVRCVFKLSRGIENATNPRHKIPLSPPLVLFEFFGGKHVVFSRLLRGEKKRFLSFALSSRGARRTARGKKHTNRIEGMRFTKPSHSACVHRFARAPYSGALSRHLFFLLSSRESEPSSSSARILLTKKKAIKKTSKTALASSDANARFQNKRRVVKRTMVRDFIATALPTKAVCWTLVAANIFSSVSFLRKNSEVTHALYLLFLLFFSLFCCLWGKHRSSSLSLDLIPRTSKINIIEKATTASLWRHFSPRTKSVCFT